MTASASLHNTRLEGGRGLIDTLQRYRTTLPFAEAELACHTQLHAELNAQQARDIATLTAWRSALSARWECEIAAQRVATTVRRALNLAPLQTALPTQGLTAVELLNELRYLEASLAIGQPLAPEHALLANDLSNAMNLLAEAIENTRRCEAERRSALAEQSLLQVLYERALGRTQRLLQDHLPAESSSG